MASTPPKYIRQLGLWFPIYGTIKNVLNHQPDIVCSFSGDYITLQRSESPNPGNFGVGLLLLTSPGFGNVDPGHRAITRPVLLATYIWLWKDWKNGHIVYVYESRTSVAMSCGGSWAFSTKQPVGSRSYSRISCSFDARWGLVDHWPWTWILSN